jgi:hypothetical protein
MLNCLGTGYNTLSHRLSTRFHALSNGNHSLPDCLSACLHAMPNRLATGKCSAQNGTNRKAGT